jgi:hypothetical protein
MSSALVQGVVRSPDGARLGRWRGGAPAIGWRWTLASCLVSAPSRSTRRVGWHAARPARRVDAPQCEPSRNGEDRAVRPAPRTHQRRPKGSDPTPDLVTARSARRPHASTSTQEQRPEPDLVTARSALAPPRHIIGQRQATRTQPEPAPARNTPAWHRHLGHLGSGAPSTSPNPTPHRTTVARDLPQPA